MTACTTRAIVKCPTCKGMGMDCCPTCLGRGTVVAKLLPEPMDAESTPVEELHPGREYCEPLCYLAPRER